MRPHLLKRCARYKLVSDYSASIPDAERVKIGAEAIITHIGQSFLQERCVCLKPALDEELGLFRYGKVWLEVFHAQKKPSPCSQLKESTDSNPRRGRLSEVSIHASPSLSRGKIQKMLCAAKAHYALRATDPPVSKRPTAPCRAHAQRAVRAIGQSRRRLYGGLARSSASARRVSARGACTKQTAYAVCPEGVRIREAVPNQRSLGGA